MYMYTCSYMYISIMLTARVQCVCVCDLELGPLFDESCYFLTCLLERVAERVWVSEFGVLLVHTLHLLHRFPGGRGREGREGEKEEETEREGRDRGRVSAETGGTQYGTHTNIVMYIVYVHVHLSVQSCTDLSAMALLIWPSRSLTLAASFFLLGSGGR